MPRERFYSAHSCLFYLSGQVLLLPSSGFGPLAHNLLCIVTEKANTCPCPSLVESGMDFLGGQATLRGSLWIISIILVCQQENQPLLVMFWKRKAASPGFSMFWVGLPHSSEVPPNKSPKSRCHTQHLIPCSLPSGDPLAPVRLIQRCSKHFTRPWVKLGWYLGGTWNILKLNPNMEWFQILKADYDLSYDRSQSSSLWCANEDWRACFPWASWLSACGSLGWRIWRFWSWKFMGSWQLVAINKKGEEKQTLKRYRRDFRKNIAGTEDSSATHTQWQWKKLCGLEHALM